MESTSLLTKSMHAENIAASKAGMFFGKFGNMELRCRQLLSPTEQSFFRNGDCFIEVSEVRQCWHAVVGIEQVYLHVA